MFIRVSALTVDAPSDFDPIASGAACGYIRGDMISPIFRLALGGLFILLGLAGLVLPILQGWLFLGLGILILSADVPFLRRFICWFEDRIPIVRRIMSRLRSALKKHDKAFPPCPPKD